MDGADPGLTPTDECAHRPARGYGRVTIEQVTLIEMFCESSWATAVIVTSVGVSFGQCKIAAVRDVTLWSSRHRCGSTEISDPGHRVEAVVEVAPVIPAEIGEQRQERSLPGRSPRPTSRAMWNAGSTPQGPAKRCYGCIGLMSWK